jgi:hypothetical protein
LALAGLGLRQVISSSVPQVVAAVLIALVLIRISLRLVRRNHDCLFGQQIPPGDKDRVRTFLLAYPGVTRCDNSFSLTSARAGWVLARIDIAETSVAVRSQRSSAASKQTWKKSRYSSTGLTSFPSEKIPLAS